MSEHQTLTEVMINTDIKEYSSPSFPKAILSASREEFDGRDDEHQPLKLTVRKGITKEEVKLPPDLQGHLFIIGPVGSVASVSVNKNNKAVDCQDEDEHDTKLTVLPSKDGWTPLFNGDGMVYRLDFENGDAQLMTRIIKTPCYYADEATYTHEEYKNLKFEDVGITRLSLKSLGVRNQVNTAFLSLKFPQEQSDRLLVTWDVGRPYEIDPKTLEVVAPVGLNKDWRELTPFVKPRPFKQVMTSAHPCFDPNTGEMFTVNIGKSLSTLLGLSRSISSRLQKNASYLQSINFSKSPFTPDFRQKVAKWFSFSLKILQGLEKFSQLFAKKDFVYLMCWDGEDVSISKRWRVLLPDGRNLKIEQSLHQMGLTRDYVVLADTGFKLLLEHFLPYQNSQLAEDAKILIADLLDYPQLPFTKVYIIRRDDLISSKSESQTVLQFLQRIVSKEPLEELPVVVAKEVQLPFEMAHYLVDYDNPEQKITLHVAHNCAADPAEFIRLFDRSVYDDRSEYDDPKVTSDLQQLAGMVVGPMDVSRLGCYVINAESGEIVSEKVISNKNYTWATAFCAYRDDIPTGQFKDIYWNNWGCWQDILTKRTFDAYKDYEGGRQLSPEDVLKTTKEGVPSSLCHLHIDNSQEVKLEIKKDAYQFPQGYLGTSIQYVPRANKIEQPDDQTDGYIICVVLHSDNLFSYKSNEYDNSKWSDNSEIWIFNAENLQEGPLYRLSHHKLNFGFTLHTTWLKEIAARPARNYDVREDHDDLIDKQPLRDREKIRQMFEKEVYPKFQRNS